MANNCEFSMRITGGKAEIGEMGSMLKWEGKFKNNGLGRVYCFDELNIQSTRQSNIFFVDGHGDCAWSVLTAMCKEYRNGGRSLESETNRLGLIVEVYSSEPGCCFQEHYLIAKGNVIVNECKDYNEYWTEGMSEEELEDLRQSLGYTSIEELLDNANENGDICIGGFGENYGVFGDVLQYFTDCEMY